MDEESLTNEVSIELSLVCILPEQMQWSEETHGLGEAASVGEEIGNHPLRLSSRRALGVTAEGTQQVNPGAAHTHVRYLVFIPQ